MGLVLRFQENNSKNIILEKSINSYSNIKYIGQIRNRNLNHVFGLMVMARHMKTYLLKTIQAKTSKKYFYVT